MAAASAVLDVIQQNGLQDNALNVGGYLRERLAALGQRHALVGEVRGAGLFIGLELVADRATRAPATAQRSSISSMTIRAASPPIASRACCHGMRCRQKAPNISLPPATRGPN